MDTAFKVFFIVLGIIVSITGLLGLCNVSFFSKFIQRRYEKTYTEESIKKYQKKSSIAEIICGIVCIIEVISESYGNKIVSFVSYIFGIIGCVIILISISNLQKKDNKN